MSPITIAFAFLFVGLLISIIKFIYTGHKFIKYIKDCHPAKWEDLSYPKNVGKILWPFGEGTATHFIYKSKETFGDESIEKFRARIRHHTFFLVILYPLSFMAFIVVIVWFLERHNGGGFFSSWK